VLSAISILFPGHPVPYAKGYSVISRHFIKLHIRHHETALLFEIHEQVRTGIEENLNDDAFHKKVPRCLRFDTMDMRSILIDVEHVQALGFTTDATEWSARPAQDAERALFYLRDCAVPLAARVDRPDQLFDGVTNIGFRTSVVRYIDLEVDDGDSLRLTAADVVCVVAPQRMYNEGRRIVASEDGLPLDG